MVSGLVLEKKEGKKSKEFDENPMHFLKLFNIVVCAELARMLRTLN